MKSSALEIRRECLSNGELYTWFGKLDFSFSFSLNIKIIPSYCSTVPASLQAHRLRDCSKGKDKAESEDDLCSHPLIFPLTLKYTVLNFQERVFI